MATQTPTQRRAAGKKAAATRKRNEAARKGRAARGAARSTTRTAARSTGRTTARKRTNSRARATTRPRPSTTAHKTADAAATRVSAETTRLEGLAVQAERVVLVPVGAALIARDNVVDAVKPFRKRNSAEREIRRFERRGNTARNQLEREVKRTRTRVERLVRRNRRNVETQVKSARRDFGRGAGKLQDGASTVVRDVQDSVLA